jgi:hypothetical protein
VAVLKLEFKMANCDQLKLSNLKYIWQPIYASGCNITIIHFFHNFFVGQQKHIFSGCDPPIRTRLSITTKLCCICGIKKTICIDIF